MWQQRGARTTDLCLRVISPPFCVKFWNRRNKMSGWLLIFTLSLHLPLEHASLPLIINTWPFKNATAAGKTQSHLKRVQLAAFASVRHVTSSRKKSVCFSTLVILFSQVNWYLCHQAQVRYLNSRIRTSRYFISLLIFCHGLLYLRWLYV